MRLTVEQHMIALSEAHPMTSTGVELDDSEEIPDDACCGAINRKTGSQCFRKLAHTDGEAYSHPDHVSYDHDMYETWPLGQKSAPPKELLAHATEFKFTWDDCDYTIKKLHREDTWACYCVLPGVRQSYLTPEGKWRDGIWTRRTSEGSYFTTAGEALAVLRRNPYSKTKEAS